MFTGNLLFADDVERVAVLAGALRPVPDDPVPELHVNLHRLHAGLLVVVADQEPQDVGAFPADGFEQVAFGVAHKLFPARPFGEGLPFEFGAVGIEFPADAVPVEPGHAQPRRLKERVVKEFRLGRGHGEPSRWITVQNDMNRDLSKSTGIRGNLFR